MSQSFWQRHFLRKGQNLTSVQKGGSLRAEEDAPGLERLYCGQTLLAVILGASFRGEGISFFTPGNFSQQLGYMNRPSGHIIPPHEHNPVSRQVELTQETLFVRSGSVRVDFYSPQSRQYLGSRHLGPGDIILLAHGGHGFEMLEKSEIVEIKQGPYAGDDDKTRFAPHTGPLAGRHAGG